MIPWAALLRHAPTIVAAADTLLTRARTRSDEAPYSLEERLKRLEQSSSESAQLLHEIAEQVNALTLAQRKTSRLAAAALVMSGVAAVLAVSVFVLTIWS